MSSFLDKFRRKKNCSVVVGIDGLPHSLLLKLAERGVMPYMGSLAESGALTRMKVTLPEISAVSWPSFMTGAGPGAHGIYGFTDLKPGSYDMYFNSFADLKTPTFWDKLGEAEKRCIVINQPGTYPARKINGVLVAGFVAIELVKAVYPPSWIGKIKRMDYQIDIDTQLCRKNHKQLFVELERSLDGRKRAVDTLWEKEDWDYLQAVVTGTDRLQHYIWNAIEDESDPNHQKTLDYYSAVDSFVKHIHEKYLSTTGESGPGKSFFMLSDHGFCGIKQEVYLNSWLKKEGYLKFENPEPKGIEDITGDSEVFVMDPGRFYIHHKNKYPRGCVDEKRAAEIKGELKSKLGEVEYEGEKVIQSVSEADEIYSGPEVQNAPDLVATPVDGFDLKGSPAGDEVFRRTDLQGMHTWDDAFFWSENSPSDNLDITMLADIVTEPIK